MIAGIEEIAWILPLYALMLLILAVPLILFAILLWKLHSSVNLIDTDIIYEHQKASKRFITNINDMMEAWIEDKKGKK